VNGLPRGIFRRLEAGSTLLKFLFQKIPLKLPHQCIHGQHQLTAPFRIRFVVG